MPTVSTDRAPPGSLEAHARGGRERQPRDACGLREGGWRASLASVSRPRCGGGEKEPQTELFTLGEL